jgi:uncharacterized protein YkwD
MRGAVAGVQRRTDRCPMPKGSARADACAPAQRIAIMLGLAVAFVLSSSAEARADTLRLAFPDGQPMTHGSACLGEGCLQRGAGIAYADGEGEVRLPSTADATVEYRRDGIDLALAPLGSASGQARPTSERTTVVFPRLLQGTAAAVDAVETDIVARINEARAARGLSLAQLNPRLSAAADLQATWLSSSGLGLPLPLLSHTGPFGTTLRFRLAEASFAEPIGGSEVAAAGMTPAQALATWLLSAPHRDVVLAPGPQLIGVGQVGSVTIVDTHPPCAGCAVAAPALGGGSTAGPGSANAPGNAGSGDGPATSGAAGGRAPRCGAEQLRVRRLTSRGGRMRLRVTVGCLRPASGYTLAVLQRPSRKRLATRTIAGAGAITLAIRPSRTARALGIKLKRGSRAVAARTVSRRAPARR